MSNACVYEEQQEEDLILDLCEELKKRASEGVVAAARFNSGGWELLDQPQLSDASLMHVQTQFFLGVSQSSSMTQTQHTNCAGRHSNIPVV